MADMASVSIGPPEVTHYIPVPIGVKAVNPSPTGVFLPNGFTYPCTVDVILHLHGNRDGGPKTWKFDTIDQYWGGSYPGGETPVKLREDLNTAGKHSVVLVAPTLGKYPGGNTADNGNFMTQAADAPNGFLEKVLAELANREPKFQASTCPLPEKNKGDAKPKVAPKVAPKVGKIVLSAHSGGGVPLLEQVNRMQGTVCEVWLFDAVYVSLDRWVSAIEDNPDVNFYFHFGTAPQQDRAEKIQKMYSYDYDHKDVQVDGYAYGLGKYVKYGYLAGGKRNVFIVPGPKDDHFGALTQGFLPRLRAATCIK
jgi:hypothetical protein